MDAVANVLEAAEAVGRVAWHFWIVVQPDANIDTDEGLKDPPQSFGYPPGCFWATRELASPSTPEERDGLAGEVIREYVRAAGAKEFES
jgi:hypothetical protein